MHAHLFKDALRLAVWRRPLADESTLSAVSLLALFACVCTVVLLTSFNLSTGLKAFDLYGVNSALANLGAATMIMALFAGTGRFAPTFRALMLVWTVAALASQLATFCFGKLGFLDEEAASTGATISMLVIIAGLFVWEIGMLRAAFRASQAVRRPLLRGIALSVALVVVAIAIPSRPMFPPEGLADQPKNVWEAIAKLKSDKREASPEYQARLRQWEITSARAEAGEAARLSKELAGLGPRTANATNVFVITVAGWGYQDVFQHEAQASSAILDQRFHTHAHTLRLINDDEETSDAPHATIQNLGTAMRAVAAKMDPDKDVLILTMTSHGSTEGFALRDATLQVWRTLDPGTLRSMLDDAGIKNRVIIVAACYSGVFVPALANDDTLIMTAAAKDRTSFGCASGRKWTYFGEAFFSFGLNDPSRPTLAKAFDIARRKIDLWEREQHIAVSNPQISVGAAIARRFPDLIGAPGDAVGSGTAPPPKRSST